MTKLNVLHTVASLHPAGGGPSRTVTQYTDSLANLSDLFVTLISQQRSGEPAIPSLNPSVTRISAETAKSLAFTLGLPQRRALQEHMHASAPTIMHDHGLWMPSNHWVARAARCTNTPFIIQPRGMLEPWAINYKVWRKRFAMGLYQWRDLQTANVLVATSATECENLRSLGLRQPIAIIPNGVNLQEKNNFLARSTLPKQRRNVLFLSRVQEKKGLLNLIEAWAQIRPVGWCLQIAGPDESGHLAKVLEAAKNAGVASDVDYIGVVDGEAKSQLYRRAEFFVLPTFSENFGVVVAEALSHGLPVITTRGAPWEDLAKYQCGWWIDIGAAPLAEALREAMALSDLERRAYGNRGREYVSRYEWGGIAAQTADMYRWVLGQIDKPSFVQIY